MSTINMEEASAILNVIPTGVYAAFTRYCDTHFGTSPASLAGEDPNFVVQSLGHFLSTQRLGLTP